MAKRMTRAGVALTLAAAALAAAAPTAGASNPGSDTAQWDCIGFFRANAFPGTPVDQGNRQSEGAPLGGIGEFAPNAQPCS